MGTYMYDKKELIDKMIESIENVEGDFTDKSLQEALEVMKLYPYVCDKTKSEVKWRKAVNGS